MVDEAHVQYSKPWRRDILHEFSHGQLRFAGGTAMTRVMKQAIVGRDRILLNLR